MILAIVFAQAWGVIQLIVLGTLARTVRVRTVLAAMAVGLYAIGPLTVILQLSWIRVVAAIAGKSVIEMTGVASYTVDPFIEEALKLLPLVLLMLIPAVRRQWSLTDCVLIAAAVGSGYGLAEHLYRYASVPDMSQGVSGGWAIPFGRITPMVPGIFNSLTSWLPPGIWFEQDPTRINWHLAWSAIGGLAVGLAVRNPKRSARLAAAGLFLLIGLDHAAGNTHDIANTWMAFLAWPLDLFSSHLGFFAFAALVAALWLDRSAQHIGEAREPLLAAERSASSPLVGLLTAAVARLPWSLSWVLGFDRARRAYYAAHASAPGSVSDLYQALVAERDRVDLKLTQPAPPIIPASLKPDALRAMLRRRPVIISLVLLAPSILYLFIGGYPQTVWVQTFVKSGLVWPLVLLITISAQSRLALRVVRGTQRMAKSFQLPIGDDAALLGLQLACGVGSVVLGGFTLLRVFGGVHPGSTLLSHDAHGADAASRATPADGASVSNSGGGFGPSGSGSGNSNSGQGSNSPGSSNSNSGSQPSAQEPPAPASNDGSPSDYSPLPPPSPPPPSDPSDFQPAPPNANADSPSDYSPLPDPVTNVHDLPDAPPDPVNVHDLPDAPPEPVNVHDLPDAPPADDGVGTRVPDNEDGVGTRVPDSDGPTIEPVKPANADHGTPDDEDGYGTREPDNEDGYGTRHPDPTPTPSRPQPTAQDQADRAADDAADAAAKAQADAEQADAEARAAAENRRNIINAQDSDEIKRTTTPPPGGDPDLEAARDRVRDAGNAAEKADKAALDGDDPWDPNAPNKSAADAAQRELDDARKAETDARNAYDQREIADAEAARANAAAAKAAATDSQNALDAANAKAQAAHDTADAAARDASRAADPLGAAADDAAKEAAEAQHRANAAYGGSDANAYEEAQQAAILAKQRADAAQAAADAAHEAGSGTTPWTHKKP